MTSSRTLRTVRAGMVPVAALVAAFTALATVTVHAQHVAAGYELEGAVRETVCRQREIQRLETKRAALRTPAAIQAAAERHGIVLERPSSGRPTTIDLDEHVRRRALPVEDTIWARNVR